MKGEYVPLVVRREGGHFNFSWVQTSSQIASKLMINKQESNAMPFPLLMPVVVNY